MNTKSCVKLSLALLAAQLAFAPPSHASRLVDDVVSGTVSGPVIGEKLSVDGKTYKVAPTRANTAAMVNLNSGDKVKLMLSGKPASPDTQVISISKAMPGEGK